MHLDVQNSVPSMHQISGVGFAKERTELPDIPAYADKGNMPYRTVIKRLATVRHPWISGSYWH